LNTVDLLGAPLQPGGALNSVGSINLPARATTSFGTELYSIGDGVTPLFTTGLVYGLYTNTNIGGFGLGLQFGNNTPDAAGVTSPSGWVITPDSGQTVGTSANLLWVYDPQQDGFGVASGNSMYLIIEGNAVPTPGALAIAGLGGLLAARRRR
jgi:MYXO-CTERM domain-containing protein